MVQIYKTPFAAQGDKDTIPVPVQGDGAVSVTQGFGYDYEREYEDPAAKDIRREIMNGILHDLSEAIGEMQQFGFAAWQPVDGGWPVGANVNHGGRVWQSLANTNTEEPGTGPLWKPILFDNIGQANEADLGLVQLATVAQAQALVNDANALTPAKLAGAFGGANQALAVNGYQKLPGGLIIQWGWSGRASDGVAIANFPIAFPNAAFIALGGEMTGHATAPTGVHLVGHQFNQLSTTGTRFWIVTSAGVGITGENVEYVVIGY